MDQMERTFRAEFAEAKVEEIERSWSDALNLMATNYSGTLVGDPQKGFLAVRAEGVSADFNEPMKEMSPPLPANLLFTKFGPVIAWISGAYVPWEGRITYWQKPEVQEAILKFARTQLTTAIAKGRPRYEHEMRVQTNLTLPNFSEAKDKREEKAFLFVNPLDEKLGDACLRNLQGIHKHNQEVEFVELKTGLNAAIGMATKFSTPPTPQT